MMHCTGLIYEFLSLLELELLSGVSPYGNNSEVALLIINKTKFSRSKQKKKNPTKTNKTKSTTTPKTNKKANLDSYCQLLSKCGHKTEDYAGHIDVFVTGACAQI